MKLDDIIYIQEKCLKFDLGQFEVILYNRTRDLWFVRTVNFARGTRYFWAGTDRWFHSDSTLCDQALMTWDQVWEFVRDPEYLRYLEQQ